MAVTKSQYCGMVTALVAVTLGGCSGGNEPSGIYKAADAERLANAAPRTPGWSPWPEKPEPEKRSSESLEEKAAREPIIAEYLRRTADIEAPDDWDYGNRWQDDGRLANLIVEVFDTPADAHVGFLASNDMVRAFGAKFGSVVKAEKVEGLGDEAWRLWTHQDGRGVTYNWRRDNLVTSVQIDCWGGCPDVDADVDAAARAWAETIDEEARSVRG
jgi:hypothetical protein